MSKQSRLNKEKAAKAKSPGGQAQSAPNNSQKKNEGQQPRDRANSGDSGSNNPDNMRQ